MAYGDRDGVGVLVPKWAGTSGNFSTTTRPTADTVDSWLNEISTILDIALSMVGFETPIVNADVTPALDSFVNAEVASMVEGVNGSGKFGPQAAKRGKSRFNIVAEAVSSFVDEFKLGMERLGAERSFDVTSGLSGRLTSNSGKESFPLFQRDGYGQGDWKDWDV